MKQIYVDVMDDGSIKIETHGFTGEACIEESEFLKDLLGVELSRQLTPAYYTQNQIKVKQHLPLCG